MSYVEGQGVGIVQHEWLITVSFQHSTAYHVSTQHSGRVPFSIGSQLDKFAEYDHAELVTTSPNLSKTAPSML